MLIKVLKVSFKFHLIDTNSLWCKISEFEGPKNQDKSVHRSQSKKSQQFHRFSNLNFSNKKRDVASISSCQVQQLQKQFSRRKTSTKISLQIPSTISDQKTVLHLISNQYRWYYYLIEFNFPSSSFWYTRLTLPRSKKEYD